MPKKTIAIDYQACDPNQCENGICKATRVCERRIITQEADYEMPDANASMCLSCALCVLACPRDAIRVM